MYVQNLSLASWGLSVNGFTPADDKHSDLLTTSFALSGISSPPAHSSLSDDEVNALLAEMEPEIKSADRDLRDIDVLEKRGVLAAGKLPGE